jgi:lipopolysaccharide export system permease protein
LLLQTKGLDAPAKGRRPWVTVFDKMVAFDLLKTLLSVWSMIVVIIVSRAFLRILDKAVDGEISNETLLTLLALKTVITSVELLPAAVFMAVLMVIGRMYRDQEMSAVASAGGGSGTVYRAVLLLLLPLSLATVGLSFYVAPWAEAGIEKLQHRDKQSADLRGIAAGKFTEYSHGDLVFYVENIDAKKVMHKVFLQQRDGSRLVILNAETGRMEERPKGRYMVFGKGERVQGLPGDLDYVLEEFDEYAVQLEGKASTMYYPREAMSLNQLIQSWTLPDIAELQRRSFIPVSVLLLAFLAVPLCQISPRGGVYGNITAGFLIYLIYGNLIRVSKALVIKSTVSTLVGAVAVNLLFFLLGCVLLARLYGWRWLVLKCKAAA